MPALIFVNTFSSLIFAYFQLWLYYNSFYSHFYKTDANDLFFFCSKVHKSQYCSQNIPTKNHCGMLVLVECVSFICDNIAFDVDSMLICNMNLNLF